MHWCFFSCSLTYGLFNHMHMNAHPYNHSCFSLQKEYRSYFSLLEMKKDNGRLNSKSNESMSYKTIVLGMNCQQRICSLPLHKHSWKTYLFHNWRWQQCCNNKICASPSSHFVLLISYSYSRVRRRVWPVACLIQQPHDKPCCHISLKCLVVKYEKIAWI